MKRIAFFHPVDDRYGASNILSYILSFVSKGYSCDVYIPQLTGEMLSVLKELGVKDVSFYELAYIPLSHRAMFNPSGLLKWSFMNVKMMFFLIGHRKKYNLIYINTLSLFSISLLSKLVGVKNIVHCHEYLKETVYGSIIRWVVYIGANAVISVSNHVNHYIFVRGSKYFIVHNGIPGLKDSDVKSKTVDTNKSHINMALVGRIMPEKGHWFLIDALSLLSSSIRSEIKIHIYGDAPPTRPKLADEFSGLIKEKGLEDMIILHGFNRNAAVEILTMDICLVPSMMADPFPTTVLEAMRAGKPVISTNHGGAKEVINDHNNGFLISPGDVESFTKILQFVVENRDKLTKIGSNAKTTFDNEFTMDLFKKHLLKVLKQYI